MDRGRVLLALGAAALVSTGAAFAGYSLPAGSVHQASGKDGCYTADGSSEAGAGTCHNIRGGEGSTTLTISPDGHFAYLVGYGKYPIPPVLSVFRRDPNNGTLHQLPGKTGCFSLDGSSEDGTKTCANARDLDTGDATSIVISSDGRFVYVASQLAMGANRVGGVAVFQRNLKTGQLRQLPGNAGCVSTAGASEDGPHTCTSAREVDYVSNVHLTPDQKFLYASDYNPDFSGIHSGIAIFRRNSKNGTLHQLKGANGCITPEGTTAESGSNKVCRAATSINQPWDVATPDNHFAYIGASFTPPLIQAFERNAKGGLVPLKGKGACVSDSGGGPAGPCVNGRGLLNPERIVPSQNGRFLYVASYNEPSPIAVLDRNPKTGALSERSGTAACISMDGTTGDGETCRNGRAIDGNYAGILSPDGPTLYYSEWYGNGLTIFHVSPTTGAFHQLSGKRGCVTFDGSSKDGANTCQIGRAVKGGYQVALGSKGRDVYVIGDKDNGVALFHAAP
jgi:hypothetical protein